MRKLLFTSAAFLLMTMATYAQKVVKGKVTDEDGKPVPSASVTVKGTKIGTTTDENGNYTITVPNDSKTIVITSIGNAEKEIQVNQSGVFNVSLQQSIAKGDEVVVIAYGTSKKSALTGSVTSVGASEIEKRPITNAIGVLEGAGAGIQVNNTIGEPGSNATIRIRGFGSLTNNSPLIIVDNAPFGGNLTDISPVDIESISVLKDGSAASLYGSAAANGVIVVTTKRSAKGGKSMVDIVANQGLYQRGINEYSRVNAKEYMEVMWQGFKNELKSNDPVLYPTDAIAGARASQYLVSDKLRLNIFDKPANQLFDTNGKLLPNVSILPGYVDDLDWFKPIERIGHRQDYTLSGRNGNDKNGMSFSVGYVDEKGYLKYSDYKRFSGRLNANLQVNDWFKYGFNLSASHQMSNNSPAGTGSSGSIVNPISFARSIAPIYPVHLHNTTTGDYVLDGSGNKIYDDGSVTRLQSVARHAIWENELNKDKTTRNTLNGRAYVDISILKNLVFSVNGDLNVRNNDNETYNSAVIGDGQGNNGRINSTNYRYKNYNWRQSLNWNEKFGQHDVDVFVAHENYANRYNYLYGYKTNESFANNPFFSNFNNITSLNGYEVETRTESYLGRVRYGYNDKVFVDVSLRRDGNSRYSSDTRWGTFWSVGGSWLINKEKFLENVSWLDQLKLRASYGELGNRDAATEYAWMALYTVAQNGNAAALYKVQNEARDLKWETSGMYDLGISGTLFKKLSFEVTYFDKRSIDLIFDVNRPLSAGGTSTSNAESTIAQNIGTLSNRGFEITVDYSILNTKDFSVSLGANATLMKNEFLKLPPENRENGIINGTKKYMEGHGIYDFWLNQFVGVDQMTGRSLYKPNTKDYNVNGSDPSKNPIPAEHLVEINGQYYTLNTTYAERNWSGSAIPKVFGSVTPSVRYKNLTFSAVITYAFGGKTYDDSYASLMSTSGTPSSMHTDVLRSWKGIPEGMTEKSENRIDPNGIPEINFKNSTNNNATSSRFLQDGSYIVLKNINVSYKIPQAILSKYKIRNASVSFAVENLYTYTKLMGMNPQQSFAGTSVNAFVTPRVMSFGINLGL
ncbi:SusC/RagA family TonB-linked outer membrane protein [Polluticaenibacter yanchengensis]|uniref:SusC/RagA family TonB-linked outer membrane protein n=1 Tax=Polluticaenibacter yanchengensis TaxID=3014562 RepID=A0ABT4UN18_9BACT|nr:SusC/RagA family TonB-linked outer membrane protein [Chitinophagaceae bacterium LY-5]